MLPRECNCSGKYLVPVVIRKIVGDWMRETWGGWDDTTLYPWVLTQLFHLQIKIISFLPLLLQHLLFKMLLDCPKHTKKKKPKKNLNFECPPELCQTFLNKDILVNSGMSLWDQLQNLSQLNMAPAASRSVGFELKFTIPTISECPKCCFHCNLAIITQG